MNESKSSIKKRLRRLFNLHFEWAALAAGVLVMALMNPYAEAGTSWCLFERLGFAFCPGDGLGHSIAFFFRGDFIHAWQANVMGPFAVIIILSRVGYLLKQNVWNKKTTDLWHN